MTAYPRLAALRSAGLMLLCTALVGGLCIAVARYLVVSPDEYSFVQQRAVYAAKQPILMLHVGAGIAAMVLGLGQFLGRRWRMTRAAHRTLGCAYVGAVLLSAGAGLNLSTSTFEGPPTGVAFAALAILWVTSTLMALARAMVGDHAGHRRWIIRSYAMSCSALTMRTQLGAAIYGAGLSMADAYVIAAWGGWALNLIVVEWWILARQPGAAREAPRQRASAQVGSPAYQAGVIAAYRVE
ncbi:MAG: DUF2306 domain-containing protein [Pseudomonadota bacterium]